MTPSVLGRIVLLCLLAPYSLWVIFAYEYHFLDHANLAIHEAGHAFFATFGETLEILGGTLAQWLAPALAALGFARQRKFFEAAVSLLWLGESFCYASVYMADAMRGMLPLVGGHIHDWEWLFGRWNCLQHCETIGFGVRLVGSACILAALGAAGYVTYAEALSHSSSEPQRSSARAD